MPEMRPTCVHKLTKFETVSEETGSIIFKRVKFTCSARDPMPINLLIGSVNFGLMIGIVTIMVNASIIDGILSYSEKTGIVTPVLKGNLDSQSLSSYWPVSNLTFQSKILENVLPAQLVEHLNKVGIIPDDQSAYRELYTLLRPR